MKPARTKIPVKSAREIEGMRAACRVAAETMDVIIRQVRPGVTTKELDASAEEYLRGAGARPAFKGYRGYPASTCISVNEELIHGIPGPRALCSGDIVSVDLGAVVDGFIGDLARTVAVGAVPEDVRRLVEAAAQAFEAGCAALRAGVRVGDISHAVEEFCRAAGYGVVQDYVGHGIGRALHEPPQVPNVGEAGTGPALSAGVTLAIEPMITLGGHAVRVRADRWTVETADGQPCAHYENTVLVTEDGSEILTVTT
jgi:methionyl aminopeptidase